MAYQTSSPHPTMVTEEGTVLDSSVSSFTKKAEPSEVGQSVGEERNKSGF